MWPLLEDAIIVKLIWSLSLSILEVKCVITAGRCDGHCPVLSHVWYREVNELITPGENNLVGLSGQINIDIGTISSFESKIASANSIVCSALSVTVAVVHSFAFLGYGTAVFACQAVIGDQIGQLSCCRRIVEICEHMS